MALTSPPHLFQLPSPPGTPWPEVFHQNTITLTGTLQAIRANVDHAAPNLDPDIVLTLAVTDRYAPAERRDPTPMRRRPAHSISLRLPQGKPLDGQALSLSPRQRVRIVETLEALPDRLAPDAYDESTLILSGIAQRVWTARASARSDAATPDVCVRLATYDRYAEIIPPDQIGSRRRDPQGQLPTRQAHYTTLRFPGGRTLGGETINLSPRAVLRVTAYLRSVPYRQSLHEILTHLQQIDRLREGDVQRDVQRLTQHLVVTSCICFGADTLDPSLCVSDTLTSKR